VRLGIPITSVSLQIYLVVHLLNLIFMISRVFERSTRKEKTIENERKRNNIVVTIMFTYIYMKDLILNIKAFVYMIGICTQKTLKF
jgi:hypothetical protein